MKIEIYMDVQNHDGYVFIRGVKTDLETGCQGIVPPSFTSQQHRKYCVEVQIPDLAPTYKIEAIAEEIE